jgi:hypothetical protein
VTAFSPRTDVAQADEIAHKAHNERFGPRETALKLDEPGTLAKNFPKMGSPSGVHRHARFTPLRFWGGGGKPPIRVGCVIDRIREGEVTHHCKRGRRARRSLTLLSYQTPR